MGSQRLTAIPNALIKVLEGLVCAVDEALRASLALIEDPGRPRQSLARKTTKAGGRAEEGPLETLVSLTRCCLRGRLVWRC